MINFNFDNDAYLAVTLTFTNRNEASYVLRQLNYFIDVIGRFSLLDLQCILLHVEGCSNPDIADRLVWMAPAELWERSIQESDGKYNLILPGLQIESEYDRAKRRTAEDEYLNKIKFLKGVDVE